jgi:spore maturation protein CgeB
MDLLILMDSRDRAKRRPETRDKIKRLRKKKGTISVGVHTRSDRETDPQTRMLWGDHWVRQKLEKEISGLGFDQGRNNPDINIHLFGSPVKDYDERALNMVWLYSHPDMVTIENLRQFDYIFCASLHFLKKLRVIGYLNVEFMPACTSKIPVPAPIEHDIIFLGNARGNRPDGRAIVGDMMRTGLDFKVWGNLWESILPKKYYGGRYWEYGRLEELYASAKITLNDHHPDMEREGFVSNKVFDILASGGFVISGKNRGLAPIFNDSVPEYESAEHLKELVEYYLVNPEKRQCLMEKGLKIAKTHTYAERAIQFAKGLFI